jgi:hypothetical protein
MAGPGDPEPVLERGELALRGFCEAVDTNAAKGVRQLTTAFVEAREGAGD